jgi:hypothetical protein
MKPVNLSLTQESAELIIRALIEMPFKQVNQLLHYIDHEMVISRQNTEPAPLKTLTTFPEYGVKKDGTPRKRPGRPSTK